VNKTNIHFKHFKKMLDFWRIKAKPMSSTSVEDQANVILSFLFDAGSEGILWGELRKKTKWTNSTWYEVLKYLYDTQQIIAVLSKSSYSTRQVIFFAKPFEVYSKMKGEKIRDWDLLVYKLKLK
jgi:hypothetical protein